MELSSIYKDEIERYSSQLSSVKSKRNFVTALKLLCFALFVWGIYAIISNGWGIISFVAAVSVVGFVVLTVWDSKISDKIAELKECIKCCRTELEYLDGNFSNLPTGEEYIDMSHPYAVDLDIFGDESLFQAINRTTTNRGKDTLANWLLTPCDSLKEIISRQEAAKELTSKIEWTHRFRAVGAIRHVSGDETSFIYKWAEQPPFFRGKRAKILLYVSNAITILSIVGAAFSIVPVSLATMFFMLQLGAVLISMKRINALHNSLTRFIQTITNYFFLVRSINGEEFESEKMSSLKSNLKGSYKAFAELDKILGRFDQRSNILVAIILNGIYMKDFHLIIDMDSWKARHASSVGRWIDSVTETDALVSLANFRFNHPDFATPTFTDSAILNARHMAHPLIRTINKVHNDFSVDALHNIFIVTGANMAGKSTFLRSVGVNIVLALSGNVVCAREFKMGIMNIFTSMRTTDNLAKGTSYFHAELLRLKQLVDTANSSQRLFIILDEMLKGTNSADKLTGSRRFLEKILSLPVSGVVATHDLALGDLSAQYPLNFTNKCFEIDHHGDEIIYDYILKDGVSKNMNATILLERMGLVDLIKN